MTAIYMGYSHDFSPKLRWNSFRSVNPKCNHVCRWLDVLRGNDEFITHFILHEMRHKIFHRQIWPIRGTRNLTRNFIFR
jgi:hypothetical protein